MHSVVCSIAVTAPKQGSGEGECLSQLQRKSLGGQEVLRSRVLPLVAENQHVKRVLMIMFVHIFFYCMRVERIMRKVHQLLFSPLPGFH